MTTSKTTLDLTWQEMLLRSTGALVATVGLITGLTLMV